MRRAFLLALLGGGLLVSCDLQRSSLPQDPVALAQYLGDFGIRMESPFNGAQGPWWFYKFEPKDPNALQGGALLNGKPYLPEVPNASLPMPWSFGGVGKAWIRPLNGTTWEFSPDIIPRAYRGLYSGRLEMEHFLRIWGRWYKVVSRVRVGITPEGSRLDYQPEPAEAYPLPDLPEIDLYGSYPPMAVVAVCAQPTGWQKDDPMALVSPVPHLAQPYWNAHYAVAVYETMAWGEHRRIWADYDPSLEAAPAHGFSSLTGRYIPLNYNYYYDYFVVMVNKDPRQASGFLKFWHLYNPKPLRVTREPDGSYRCENFEEENVSHYEGPFTLEEFKARFFDPTNPPEVWQRP